MRILSVTITFALCTSALHTTPQIFGVFRPDLTTNVEVAKILPEDNIPDIPKDATEIRVKAYNGSAFEFGFKCVEKGKDLTFSKDKKWVGCCAANKKLKGSETTSFDCCNEGEDITGCNAARGYGCCPSGSIYDGSTCVIIDKNPCAPCPADRILVNGHCILPCPAGQVLNNGECVCVPGTEKSAHGTCEARQCPADRILVNGHCILPCPAGKVLNNGECVCVPGTEKSAHGTCEVRQCPADRILVNGHCILPCPAGQVLNNGECVCVPGTEKSANGTCQKRCPAGSTLINGECVKPPCGTDQIRVNGHCVPLPHTGKRCPSGVQTGKCYTFTFENGQRFGHNSKSGFYTASEEDDAHQFGKFKACTNQDCTPNVDIEPGMSFKIQEIQGRGPHNGGQRRQIWLNNAKDGSYITRTPIYCDGADFVITKWPGGKHCLGGSDVGVGLTYASENVGATILTADDQSCIPMTLTEVPCDIRGERTNCIGGNKTEVSTSSPADGKVGLNASMPIDGSRVSGYS